MGRDGAARIWKGTNGVKRLLLVIVTTLPLLAQTPIREVSAGIAVEDLPADLWQEEHVALQIRSVIARASHVAFADAEDEQLELEAYPKLGARSYLYLAGAVSTESILYPEWRLGAEYYRSFGGGFEASAGYRRLEFAAPVDLATVSLGKYAGNWLLQGRVYRTEDDASWQALARRYLNDDGSYVGVRAGLGRDEIRSGSDIDAFDSTEVVAEAFVITRARWTLRARAGATRLGDEPGFTGAFALGRRF